MSFYGSVYYQLIDTFYKIIVKNSGDTNYEFNNDLINPSGTEDKDIIESPAVGRKGEILLDSGNYWINFSKSADVENIAPYKIWHSPANPNPTKDSPVGGLHVERKYVIEKNTAGDEVSITDPDTGHVMEEDKDYIQLQDSEFIRTYNAQYDEAGHVIDGKTQSILYRLPKANINERIDKLEGLVGEPTEGLEFPRPEITKEEIEKLVAAGEEYTGEDFILSLTDYAEKNFEDIKLLEEYVGDWSKSHGMYTFLKTPIAEWIGNIDDLYGSQSSYFLHHSDKTLIDLIGNVAEMWKKYNRDGSLISIADALIEIYNKVDDTIEQHNTDLEDMRKTTNNIQYIIGNPIKDDGTNKPYIYSYLDQLDKALNNAIEDSIGRDNALEEYIDDEIQTTTVGYQNADAELKEYVNARDDEINQALDEAEQNLSTAISEAKQELTSLVGSTKTELNNNITKLDEDLSKDISDLAKRLDDADAAINQNISDHISVVAEGLNAINGRIDGVVKTHDDDDAAIWAALGTGDTPGASTVYGRLNGHDSSLSGHDTRISNLETSLGTNDGNPIAGRVKKNEEDIAELQSQALETNNGNGNRFTTIEKDIVALKEVDAEHNKTISQTNTAIAEINTKISTLENINHSTFETKENAQAQYDAINGTLDEHTTTLTEVGQTIGTIQSLLGEDTEGALNEGQNVLSLLLDLSNQIRGIQDDITSIKTVINDLHHGEAEDFSDYPFPDVKRDEVNSEE